MWLPKEERKLLRIYYLAISEGLKKVDSTPTAEKQYSISELINIFSAKNFLKAASELKDYRESIEDTYEKPGQVSNNQSEQKDVVKGMKQWLAVKAVIDAGNAALAERKMIKLSKHITGTMIGVSLTIEGYDLGRRYSAWFTRTGSWFAEYRNHWIWLIVGFLGGIVGALIVQWLTS